MYTKKKKKHQWDNWSKTILGILDFWHKCKSKLYCKYTHKVYVKNSVLCTFRHQFASTNLTILLFVTSKYCYSLICDSCIQLDQSSWENTGDSGCKRCTVFPPYFACHQSGGRDFRFPCLLGRVWIMQQCGVACLPEQVDKNSWVILQKTSLHQNRTKAAKYKSLFSSGKNK